MNTKLNEILNFNNIRVDSSIICGSQVEVLVRSLLDVIDNNIEGDVVELGCYVGESSKYLMKTITETGSNKKLYVYDSFDGLPELSNWEKDSGWRAGTLKTTEDVLISNFKQNNLPLPIIHKDWFKDIPEYKIPEKISFAFLDGDFYDSIYDSLVKVFDKVVDGGYIFFHDYDRHDLPGVRAAISDFLKQKGLEYDVVEICDQLGLYRKNASVENIKTFKTKKNETTIVTGIWDIKRNELTEGWKRSFEHYLDNLAKLMKTDCNMIIYIEEQYKDFVLQHRSLTNTSILVRELDWFKGNEFYNDIQKIRNNPEWYNQVGWLTESTQAKLEMYNPLVMSKMFLLNDAAILDPFDSSHLVWIDGALTNTVHEGYFWKDNVIDNIKDYFKKFSFVCFPYETDKEIHGFEYNAMCSYAGANVNKVARGGIFGGPKASISKANEVYYSLMSDSLKNGYMGTEESLFTLMLYKYPELFQYFEIDGNGLLSLFFENLKNKSLEPKMEKTLNGRGEINSHNTDNVALYVLTFNFPEQFSKLCRSFKEYDNNFLDKPKKFLIDNSTDSGTYSEYKSLCEYYGFTHLKMKDNLGICGGRQFIAEHAEENGFDYHMFFEDDMFFYFGNEEYCKNGFRRKIPDLYNTILNIAWNEDFDFLKFNFSELFGDNTRQWSWHNIPQDVREKFFPEKPRKSTNDTNNEPFLKYNNIKSYKGIPYATGEIYYCNWPQVVSKEGNKKMFLTTKWAHPFEQTWMSYIYQETLKGNIYPGILLATPTEHDRFLFYKADERKES
jgi:O-methyltransferase